MLNLKPHWLWQTAILLVLALAFALRIEYLSAFTFHIDEFYTLTAANITAASGVPLYPTGYFYDPGLPYTYLIALLFWLMGFSEAMGRFPAVVFSVLSVAGVYRLGTQILRSKSVGLLAALLLTISAGSLAWGGSARATSLAQFLTLLSAALLWAGLTRQSSRHRILFALSYGLALLSHFSVVALLPAWFVAGVGLWRAKAFKFSKALFRDIVFFLLASGIALSSGLIFQPPPSLKFQSANAGLGAKTGALSNKFLQVPSDLAHAWKAYGSYFFTLPHLPLTLLTLFSVGLVGWQLIQNSKFKTKNSKPEIGALYFSLILLTTAGVLALVIAPHWQRNRYLVMQTSGFFFLLGAYGLWRLTAWLAKLFSVRHSPFPVHHLLFTIFSLALLFPFLSPLQQTLDAGKLGWNRYDLAFKHVRDELSEGDKVMTMNPPPAWLYLRQNDYYLVQSSPKLLLRPDGEAGDRYTGAKWISEVEDFNQVIAQPARVWLVTQEFWLFNSYEPYLQQQILQWMDKKWGEGGVWALVSRPGMWELAPEMATPVNGQFEGGVTLVGFTAEPPALTPGGVMRLTLFWRGEKMPYHRKIFVQLRNANNQTIAQADHFIYDDKVPSSRWHSLFKNGQAVRDGVSLALPPDLPPGSYRILVGFYNPDTFERIGVINDQSGEAAVILKDFIVE